jgi:hypothetical protein
MPNDLATYNPGRRFLNLYETFSPTVANFIEKRRSLRTVARVLVVRPSCLFARVLLAIRKPRT